MPCCINSSGIEFSFSLACKRSQADGVRGNVEVRARARVRARMRVRVKVRAGLP